MAAQTSVQAAAEAAAEAELQEAARNEREHREAIATLLAGKKEWQNILVMKELVKEFERKERIADTTIHDEVDDVKARIAKFQADHIHELRYDLFESAAQGFCENITGLVKDHKVDPNLKDNLGWTALHWACSRGQKNAAETLVELGGEVNIRNVAGKTPLHLAAFNGHEIPVTYPKIVKFLVDKGADVNAPDLDNITPLGYAKVNGHEFMQKLLVSKGGIEQGE